MGLDAAADSPTRARMVAAAESLVRRARAGDQNAVAMILRVREQVPHSRRAALAYELLRNYVGRHPAGAASFGRDLLRTPPMLGIADAVRPERDPAKYAALVRWVERLPSDVDRATEAAMLVADGRDVDADAVRAVLPLLRGNVVVAGGKPLSFGLARKRGIAVASEWDVTVSDGPNIQVAPRGGAEIGFAAAGRPLPSSDLFARAFRRATAAPLVLEEAASLPRPARQPIRLGYVLGLARAIQGVARRGLPIAGLSDIAAWELGEEES